MSLTVIIVLAVIILFIIICFSYYNKMVNLRNRALEAESGIDVQLKKTF